MNAESGEKFMKELIGLRAKIYSYLKATMKKIKKKPEGKKKSVIKRNLKFEDCKNCFEAARIENRINLTEKNKIDVDSLNEDQKNFIKSNKLILKAQEKLKSEKHNTLTEEINKIALSPNDDKEMLSRDLIETCVYGINENPVCKKEEIKCNNIIKQYKIFNFDYFTKEGIKEHNSILPENSDHLCSVLIVGCSGSGKTNSLLNLINREPDIH